MRLSSASFEHGAAIPRKHTCQGADTSPPLTIEEVPEGAVSLVLLNDDPDAPDPKAPRMVWDHWVVFDIPPGTRDIPEGEAPDGAVQGTNSWRRKDYGGPCPPVGRHRYFFRLYAVDKRLGLDDRATKADVERAMEGHVLARAELMGTYEKT